MGDIYAITCLHTVPNPIYDPILIRASIHDIIKLYLVASSFRNLNLPGHLLCSYKVKEVRESDFEESHMNNSKKMLANIRQATYHTISLFRNDPKKYIIDHIIFSTLF